MPDYRFVQTKLEYPWVEVRIIARQPMSLRDVDLYGAAAEFRITKFILAGAYGIATAGGRSKLCSMLKAFAQEMGMFERQPPPPQ